MAQSHPERVFLQNNVDVTMPGTPENPNGSIRRLKAGYVVLDDDLRNHPIIGRLVPQASGEQKRLARLSDIDLEYNQKLNELETWKREELSKVQIEQRDEFDSMNADYQKSADEAAARGEDFTTPHPDPATRRAQTLTASPATHMATAQEMAVISDDDKRETDRKAAEAKTDGDDDKPKRTRVQG